MNRFSLGGIAKTGLSQKKEISPESAMALFWLDTIRSIGPLSLSSFIACAINGATELSEAPM